LAIDRKVGLHVWAILRGTKGRIEQVSPEVLGKCRDRKEEYQGEEAIFGKCFHEPVIKKWKDQKAEQN
jgi:hypothetical protein